jgi:hypothetical protein
MRTKLLIFLEQKFTLLWRMSPSRIGPHTMITENDVVKHMVAYLSKNWRVIRSATTSQHGPDIIARSDGRELWIEAKGQTSSKEGTKRYGKEFNRNQKEDHLGRALLKCCQYLSEKPELTVAIAVPNDTLNSDLINRIAPALQRLRITSFLVSENGTVETSSDI